MGPSRLYRNPSKTHVFSRCFAILFRGTNGFFIEILDLFGRNPPGDRATTQADHLVSFSALNSKIQPYWSTIFIFFCICFQKKHENTTFPASLEPQGPRDLPSMKERKISYKMHGSRAPYDQMAPQLCQFYVPGQPSKRQFVKKTWSGGYKKHRPDKRKVQICPICIRF